MKYFKKIEGERLYLSPISMEDAEIYTKWLNDFKVTDGLCLSSQLNNIESEKEWIQKTLEKGELSFAIIKKENDTLIGNISFSKVDYKNQKTEVGIFIGEEEDKNKGYGTEALKLLIKYGFEYQNFNNIMLKVFSFNEGAIKCYKKVGFKEFGRRSQTYIINNNWYDTIYMEILKNDYFKKNN